MLVTVDAILIDGAVGGRRVEVNGMQMYYEVSGEGDPLIVLHGGTSLAGRC